jgi:flagellar hook-basal body complex protein FliE
MSDLSIKSAGSSPVGNLSGQAAASGSVGNSSGAFWGSLKDAIAKVNDAQIQAGQEVDKFVSGDHQNVHQMMVALQKADVSFQLMMQIRNKLVSAYEDIQRMQI